MSFKITLMQYVLIIQTIYSNNIDLVMQLKSLQSAEFEPFKSDKLDSLLLHGLTAIPWCLPSVTLWHL